MILVAEGPSAAGKTTWAAQQPEESVVPETGDLSGAMLPTSSVPNSALPDRIGPPLGASIEQKAAFWTEVNVGRWAIAEQVESRTGLAICDTDPLKLHYHYGLATVGGGRWELFDAGVVLCRAAIADRRLGIADLVCLHIPTDAVLLAQRDEDINRRRRNFDLHRQLGPSLLDWYSALDGLAPGRVERSFPSELPSVAPRDRFDADLFVEWMSILPRPK